MTVLMKDVKSRLNTKRQNEAMNGIRFEEILYADDTIIIQSHEDVKILVRNMEMSSYKYWFILNGPTPVRKSVKQSSLAMLVK